MGELTEKTEEYQDTYEFEISLLWEDRTWETRLVEGPVTLSDVEDHELVDWWMNTHGRGKEKLVQACLYHWS